MRTEDRKVSVSEPSISKPLKAGGESVVRQSPKSLLRLTYRYVLFTGIAACGTVLGPVVEMGRF